jgi:hypothetical protein
MANRLRAPIDSLVLSADGPVPRSQAGDLISGTFITRKLREGRQVPDSAPGRRRIGSLFLAVALLALQMAPAIAAEITTDLWVYNYGDTVTVTGVDYAPLETVELVTTDPYGVEVDRGQVAADEYGGFTYQFVLLSDVSGIYDVVGTGLTSGLTAATQFDPPQWSAAFTNPFPASRQYSDVISISGTTSCANQGNPSSGTCAGASPWTVAVSLQLRGGPFADWTSVESVNAVGSGTSSVSWTLNWQIDIAPGTFDSRVFADAPTGADTALPSPSGANNGITVTAEDTASEYLGATSATEGTSLNVSAEVDDLDGGIGSGNGQFSPDTNLAGSNLMTYELRNGSCTGSVVAAVSASVDSAGGSGGNLSLASVSDGSYFLKTTYTGNAYYLTSSDCDPISVTSADSEGPTISISTTAGLATSGWYNIVSTPGTGGIDVDVSASDPSGVASFECSINAGSPSAYNPGGDTIHLGDGEHTVACDAEDGVGNTSSESEDFDVDQTAPTVSLSINGGAAWTNDENVLLGVTATDATSGVANYGFGESDPADSCPQGTAGDPTGSNPFTLTGVDANSKSAFVAVCDAAGNFAQATDDIGLDRVKPTADPDGFADGQIFYLGDTLPLPASCTTTDDRSGVATSAGPSVQDNRSINGVGSVVVTCSGHTDNAGNPGDAVSETFYVFYPGLSGILQPINTDNTSVFSRGKVVPIKFRLAGDEFFGFNTSGWELKANAVSCSVFDQVDSTLENVTSNTPFTTFRYDASADQYIYNADMRQKAVGSCWNFKVTLDSGQFFYSAVFKLQK